MQDEFAAGPDLALIIAKRDTNRDFGLCLFGLSARHRAQTFFTSALTLSTVKSRHGRLSSPANTALMPLTNAGAVGRLILRNALATCCSALASRRMRSITAA